MRVKVYPSQCHGSIQIPPSKSMAHRAIICASLANGTSRIHNISYSKDIQATIQCMRLLGANIQEHDTSVTITGITKFPQEITSTLPCEESGSTLRFLIPIFSLCNQRIYFEGKGRLLQRPQTIYQQLFDEQGLYFKQTKDYICIEGSLQPQTYTIDGNISSQFISGLLFTLPLLQEDSIIKIIPPFASKSYVDLTIDMLRHFHINVTFLDPYTIHIPGKQSYKSCDYTVEADYSQFAFYAVLAAIQGELTLTGVTHHSLQGDRQILSILASYGATIQPIKNGYHIKKGNLFAQQIDIENCPDLGPILSVLGAYANGTTTLLHASRLRIKESDRIQAMEEELHKFQITTYSDEDRLSIIGKSTLQCDEVILGHQDHRIVMAMTIAALCSQTPCIIDGAQAITKSYPNFFEDILQIHGNIEYLPL